MADEEGLRKDAVVRYLQGECAQVIAEDLGRSERWVYKWVTRYEEGDAEWFAGLSRAPNSRPTAAPDKTLALVLAARDHLEADPRAQRGAAAIAWELRCMGVAVNNIPPRWTIERILRRAGRSRPREPKGERYRAKGVPYPFDLAGVGVGAVHQVDPVGPRWLDGGQEVYSFNVIDVGSHRVAVEGTPHCTPRSYTGCLLACWSRLGIPEVVQLDNHPTLRGSAAHPRDLGPVPRVALALGVRVRYIPIREPWRNGCIEHFQDVYKKSFFRSERFRDPRHLLKRGHTFEAFHNTQHRYSAHGGRTPDEVLAEAKVMIRYPPVGFDVPERLPRRGRIEVVRFIRSDRILNLFGEKILLPKRATYQYVVAVIHVRAQRLVVVNCAGEVLYEAVHRLG